MLTFKDKLELMVTFFSWVLFVPAAIILFVSITSDMPGGFIAFLFMIPLISVYVYKKKRENEHREIIQSKFVEVIGESPRFQHYESSTGVALNEKTREIFLADAKGGFYKSYPYADIREWEVRVEGAPMSQGGMYVGNLSGATGMALNQTALAMRKAYEAKLNTGLFITVRDIQNPKWRIAMSNDTERNRWFEILSQSVNEGGVA